MRSYADMLKTNKYKIEYSKIEDKDFKDTYFDKLKILLIKKKLPKFQVLKLKTNFLKKN